MRSTIVFGLALAGSAVCCVDDARSQNLVIAGPSATLQNQSSYNWQGGSRLAQFRAALQNTAFFGPSGTVSHAITTQDLSVVSASSLQNVDVFISPWWADTTTPGSAITAVTQFFLNGGALLLYQDDSSHDAIGAALGIPTSSSDGSDSNGGIPLFDGPFGTAANVHQGGNVGRLLAADVLTHNGHVAAMNASGQVTAAYWNENEYAPGAGRLLIVSDVDMITNLNATYGPLNDNGIFALNGVAHVVCPGSISAYGAGCAGSGGFVPALHMAGCPRAGQPLAIELLDGHGGALALFVVGLATTQATVHGSCDLLVDLTPPSFVVPVMLPGANPGEGDLSFSANLPLAATAGFTFHVQAWVVDAGAGPPPFENYAASNGVTVTSG